MSTLHQVVHYNRPIHDLANPVLLSRLHETDTGGNDTDIAVRVSSILQTALTVDKVIEIFLNEASRALHIDGACYRDSELKLEKKVGVSEKYSITYRLTIAEISLGEITFSCKKRFTSKETRTLEYLLCGLVYPLRNALAYEKALQAALRDPLTGVNNRAALDNVLTREIELARRHVTSLSLIAIDIDYFKHINDTYGHATGDSVIRTVADVIQQTVRGSDMVFRYGGEEFVVLLSSTHVKGALLLAERIRRNIEINSVSCNGVTLSATVSLGVSWLEECDTGLTLFQKADSALYEAKAGGRNCVRHQQSESDYNVTSYKVGTASSR